MGLRSLSFVASVACLVGACGLTDPVDNRYDMIGRSLAVARNESIFLNIVRASHDYPLAFTTISQVTPSMTNVSTFALPSFVEGPGAISRVTTVATAPGTTALNTFPTGASRDFIFGNTTAQNQTTVSSNFNVATQETSAFYIGFLKPIDLQTVDYFIRQGYSRELLFWLFTDTVEMKAGPRVIGMRYDPPNDYGCDRTDPRHLCFPDFIRIATAAGLTVEELTQQSVGSAGGSKGGGSSGGSAGGKDTSGGGGSGGAGGKTETAIFARFCFDPVLARRAQNDMGARWDAMKKAFDVSLASPKCGSHWDPVKEAQQPQSDTLNFNVGPYQFKITPRSAFGIFEFLGNLMKLQRQQQQQQQQQDSVAFLPPNRLDLTQPPLLFTVHDDQNLITVVQNGTPACFVHTWFYDGDYCVPEDATTTKHIFSLLAQLIAIQTAASDLSITPIVRVIQ
jgi:uncharacterized membrane protein YgcG